MLKKAIEQYEKITGVAPKDVDAWVMSRVAWIAVQDNAEAERAYKKALEADPDSEDALTGLLLVYLDLQDSQAAADTLKALAEDLRPQSAGAGRDLRADEGIRAGGRLAEEGSGVELPDAAEVKQALAQDLIYAAVS